MRINALTPELQESYIQKIESAEDKSTAIIGVMEDMMGVIHGDIIDQILEEARQDKANRDKGFRVLSENEKSFYGTLKAGAKQAVTADQIDIIPVETIDYTLNEVKKASAITSLINFAPANVKKWLSASKTGAAAWGNLTDEITQELSATITAMNMDVFKLSVFCVIPKAIRDLEIGYVDRYFTAILNEAMQDGIVKGYLDGDGKIAPIGITKKIDQVNQDGTHTAKTTIATITGFSPKQMAPVLTTLSHGGLRPVSKVYLLCNPLDRYQYVNPALYGDSITGGYVAKSFLDLEVIEDANVTQGKGIFTMAGLYTMGFQGVKVDEYKETKAIEDADLVIAKVYGNGRAVDDDAAVVFNITKLEEYVPTVINQAAGE